MLKLPYYIFTSGEKGINGNDWGIKFCSLILGNKQNLNTYYYGLTKKYKLSPSLEKPDDNTIGLIVLAEKKWFEFLIIIPNKDHIKRDNVSVIGMRVSKEIIKKYSFSYLQLFEYIKSQKNIISIGYNEAKRDNIYKKRPDSISIDINELLKIKDEDIPKWSKINSGIFIINNETKYLSTNNRERKMPKNIYNEDKKDKEDRMKKNGKKKNNFIRNLFILLIIILFSLLIKYELKDKDDGDRNQKNKEKIEKIKKEGNNAKILNDFINRFDESNIFRFVVYLETNKLQKLINNKINSINMFDLKNKEYKKLINIETFDYYSKLLNITERELKNNLTQLSSEWLLRIDPDGKKFKKIQLNNVNANKYYSAITENIIEIKENINIFDLNKGLEKFLINKNIKVENIEKHKENIVFISETKDENIYSFSYLNKDDNWEEQKGIINIKNILIKKDIYEEWWKKYFKKISGTKDYILKNIENEVIIKKIIDINKNSYIEGRLTDDEIKTIIEMLVDKLIKY